MINNAIHHILIRGTNWIGDSVMSLAALRELRRQFPDHHLALFVNPPIANLFQGQDIVDEIITLKDKQTTLNRLFRFPNRIRHFDTAILFQNHLEAALVPWLAGIPERIGYSLHGRHFLLTNRAYPRIKERHRHQVYYYLDLLHQAGLSSNDYLNDPHFEPDISLHPTEESLDLAQDLLDQFNLSTSKPLIAISPGAAYGPVKRWFPERYAELADQLIEKKKAQVVLVGSPNEILLARKIENLMRQSPTILTGLTTLNTLLGLFSHCDLLITNDSGPMHLAASLNIPQIALFGSTDKIATGPLSPQAEVIYKGVECSPCLLRKCPIDLRCFSYIEVDEVYESVITKLDSN